MDKLDPRSDAELLAATPGDPDAFAAFYRRHVTMVLGVVGRRARPADVGDLVAEVFATALVHRRRYDPERGSGAAWLTGIAMNKLAQANRRGAVEARLCRRLGMHPPTLESSALDVDERATAMLQALPDQQRRAVRARVLQDKSYEVIAAQEAVSPQAVRKRVSRALNTLRSRLSEERK